MTIHRTSTERTARETPVDEWMRALAAPTPAPGGGAAGALTLAAAAALAEMVAGYAPDDRLAEPRAAAGRIRARALALCDEDAAASAALVAAHRLPDDAPDRRQRIAATTADAAGTSVDLAETAASLLPILRLLRTAADARLLPDVAVGARLAAAAARAAAVNIRCNRDPGAPDRTDSLSAADRAAAALDDLGAAVTDDV